VPFLLRVVANNAAFKGARKWTSASEAEPVLRSFQHPANKLSFFSVTTRSEVRDVCLAHVLSNPHKIQHVTFRLISSDRIDFLSSKFVENPGTTINSEVNELHFDIVGATDQERLELAYRFGKYGFGTRWRFPHVHFRIRQAHQRRWFELSDLSDEIRPDVQRIIKSAS
jgi:hypothetical protein